MVVTPAQAAQFGFGYGARESDLKNQAVAVGIDRNELDVMLQNKLGYNSGGTSDRSTSIMRYNAIFVELERIIEAQKAKLATLGVGVDLQKLPSLAKAQADILNQGVFAAPQGVVDQQSKMLSGVSESAANISDYLSKYIRDEITSETVLNDKNTAELLNESRSKTVIRDSDILEKAGASQPSETSPKATPAVQSSVVQGIGSAGALLIIAAFAMGGRKK